MYDENGRLKPQNEIDEHLSLENAIGARVMSGIFNGIYTLIYNSFNNLENFKIRKSQNQYNRLLESISSYSVYYQSNPDYKRELMKLKALKNAYN